MDTETIIGATGAVIVLGAFILNQNNKLKNDSLWYDLLNTVGSFILLVYAVMLDSVPFMVINIVWGLISLKDVVKTLLTRKNLKIKFKI